MVYRVYVEKKPGLDHEASALCADLRSFLGISALEKVRILNRYDVENIDEALFEQSKTTVFSEPQLDVCSDSIGDTSGAVVFVIVLPAALWYNRANIKP